MKHTNAVDRPPSLKLDIQNILWVGGVAFLSLGLFLLGRDMIDDKADRVLLLGSGFITRT